MLFPLLLRQGRRLRVVNHCPKLIQLVCDGTGVWTPHFLTPSIVYLTTFLYLHLLPPVFLKVTQKTTLSSLCQVNLWDIWQKEYSLVVTKVKHTSSSTNQDSGHDVFLRPFTIKVTPFWIFHGSLDHSHCAAQAVPDCPRKHWAAGRLTSALGGVSKVNKSCLPQSLYL